MSNEMTITVTANGKDGWKLLTIIKKAGLDVEAVVVTSGKQEEAPLEGGIDLNEIVEVPQAAKAPADFNKKEPTKRTKRKKWLTEATKRTLRKLAKEGKTMQEASVFTGIPYMNIFQWQKNPKSKVSFVRGKKGRKRAQ
jgi:hypothetical protein